MLHSEAIDFVENVLKIDQIQTKLKLDRLQLLREICLKVQQNIPFQNLTLLATDSSDRRLPTAEDVQSAYVSKIGGICYSAACFSKQLLSALGFDAFLIACNISRKANGNPFTHAACIVKGISSPEQRFLVDFGAGFPTFEPVPLHSLPQVYKHAFQETKYVNQKDGSVVRLNKVGHSALGELPSGAEDGWQMFYDFEVIPRDEEFLAPYQAPIYTDPNYGAWFLKGLKISYFPEGKAFTINDYVLKKWEKGGALETIVLKDANELARAIKDYFPSLADVDVHKAVINWNENKRN